MTQTNQPEKLGFFALVGKSFATVGVALNTVNNGIQAIDTTVSSLASVNENILGVAVDKSFAFREEMSIESKIELAKLKMSQIQADKEIETILNPTAQ